MRVVHVQRVASAAHALQEVLVTWALPLRIVVVVVLWLALVQLVGA